MKDDAEVAYVGRCLFCEPYNLSQVTGLQVTGLQVLDLHVTVLYTTGVNMTGLR